MTLILSTLCVMCLVATSSGWFYSHTSCQKALNDYCVKEPDVVCTTCGKNDEAACKRSADPLLCYMKNKHPCNKSDNKLCDTTLGLHYGCYRGVCWSQCVDEKYGDEWCYLAKRQLGPRVNYDCHKDAQCKPSDLKSVMCSSTCGKRPVFNK